MAQIIRPGDIGSLDRSQISLAAAGAAGAGQVAIGRETISVGRQTQQSQQLSLAAQISSAIDREGKRMFEESKLAHQSATLLNKTNEATETFIKAQQERYSRAVDENGNPTFETLHEDIGRMGSEVLERTAGTIIDPEVSRKFRERFGSYVANQKISALKTARNQQVEYGRTSLDQGLGKLVRQAARDDIDQIGSYEQQGIQSLQEALVGGVITQEEFNEQSQAFSAIVREKSIRNAITTDRQRAADLLQSSASELGLTDEKKAQLDRELDAAVKSDKVQAAKSAQIQTIDELTEETALVEDLESRIEADALREDELLSVEDQVSSRKFSELKKKFVKEAIKRQETRRKHEELSRRIVEGQDISNVKPSDIDGLHQYMVEQRADAIGQKVGLSDEARLATAIPAPVPSFAKKAEYAVKFGDTANAEEVLAAYTYIKDRNKPSLESGFDNEATLIMEHTELLVERGGMPAPQAMREARDLITKTDEKERAIREDMFRKQSEFKIDNIEETAASELDAEDFFGTNRISQDAVHTFREFVREGYIRTGSNESAIAYAKKLMGKTHGHSNVTNKEQYMFSPPEKEFPSVSSDQLREILVVDVTPLLPEGIDPDTISISSDDITVGQVQAVSLEDGRRVKRRVPSWTVTYMQEIDGEQVEVPLLDPVTGQPKRWSPIGSTLLEQKATAAQAAAVEEAQEERKGFVEEEGKRQRFRKGVLEGGASIHDIPRSD